MTDLRAKLDELQIAICELSGDAAFIAAARRYMPLLIEVARAAVIAQRISSTSNMIALGEALAALELAK